MDTDAATAAALAAVQAHLDRLEARCREAQAELAAIEAERAPRQRRPRKEKPRTGMRYEITAQAPEDPDSPYASRFHKQTVWLSEPIAFKSPTAADRILAIAERDCEERVEMLLAAGYKNIHVVRRFKRLSSHVTEIVLCRATAERR